MGDARHVRRFVRRLWPRFGGALLTVCAVATLELASGTVLRVPNPPAILLLTTVFVSLPAIVVLIGTLRRRPPGLPVTGPSTYLEGIVIEELGLALREVGGAS